MNVLAYGLTLKSEFPLPGLPVSSLIPDVEITLSTGACDLTVNTVTHPNDHCVILTLPQIATFTITDGKKIHILKHGQDDVKLRILLLGTVMTVILHQRSCLVLHGSAVDLHGAILFLGHRGAGKSTLAASLVKRGASLLSDDVCAIRFIGNTPYLLPSIPDQKLYDDALKKLDLTLEDGQPVPDNPKKSIYQSSSFISEPKPIKQVFFMHNKDIVPLDRDAFSVYDIHKNLVAMTYRYGLLNTAQKKQHFSAVSDLIPCVQWTWLPESPDRDLNALTDIVLNALKGT